MSWTFIFQFYIFSDIIIYLTECGTHFLGDELLLGVPIFLFL